MDNLSIQFADNAEGELGRLQSDLQLAKLATDISSTELSDDLKERMLNALYYFADILSTKTPVVNKDSLGETLLMAARDINLSSLLKERGLFRLYQICKTEKKGMPLWASYANPDTGTPFTTQEEMIKWFAREAHISRALIFTRLATIEKCLSLNIPLDDTFKLIITKPFVIREALNMIGEWRENKLIGINGDIAKKIAEKELPERAESISRLVDEAHGGSLESHAALLDEMKPAIANLITEVANHDRVKESLDFVRYDILNKPEINYYWDVDMDCLVVEYVRKSIDENGNEHLDTSLKIPFAPDIGELPSAVREDIIKRLPIMNRDLVLNKF